MRLAFSVSKLNLIEAVKYDATKKSLIYKDDVLKSRSNAIIFVGTFPKGEFRKTDNNALREINSP